MIIQHKNWRVLKIRDNASTCYSSDTNFCNNVINFFFQMTIKVVRLHSRLSTIKTPSKATFPVAETNSCANTPTICTIAYISKISTCANKIITINNVQGFVFALFPNCKYAEGWFIRFSWQKRLAMSKNR